MAYVAALAAIRARKLNQVDVAALAEVTLEDHEGEPHRIGDFWADQPVVLNFLRHFG